MVHVRPRTTLRLFLMLNGVHSGTYSYMHLEYKMHLQLNYNILLLDFRSIKNINFYKSATFSFHMILFLHSSAPPSLHQYMNVYISDGIGKLHVYVLQHPQF